MKSFWMTLSLSVLLLSANFAFAQTFRDSVLVDSVLTLADSPHTFDNTILVLKQGVTLGVEAGVTVNFINNARVRLLDSSELEAVGTATDTIYWNAGVIGGDSLDSDDPFNLRTTNATVSFEYTHFEQFGGTGGLKATEFKNSYFYQSVGVNGIGIFSGTPEFMRLNDCRIVETNIFFSSAFCSIGNCDFIGGNSALTSSLDEVFGTIQSAVSDCLFQDMTTAVGGNGLIEMVIGNCQFIDNEVAIDLSGSASTITLDCSFSDNQIAIEGLGDRNFNRVSNCEIKDNDIGISVTGDFFGTPPRIDNGFYDNTICNNLVNAQIFTEDSTSLQNNCWCETDSAVIVSTFDLSAVTNPGFTLLPLNNECSTGISVPRIGGLNLYPNPSDGSFQVQSEQHLIRSLEIVNQQGQLVMTASPNAWTYVAQTDLPAGLYLVRVKADAGQWQQKWMVK
ncbi:MAG: T9SS type A sorting domain-containing protein [Bacteroidota bacterium]